MKKRDAAERARHPSVVVHEHAEVCRACRPLLENERRMHDEAFQTLAAAYDRLAAELDRLRRASSGGAQGP